MADALSDFVNRAEQIPLLTADEEIILGRRIQAMVAIEQVNLDGFYTNADQATLKRGKRALDRMICGNIRLVFSIAYRHWGHIKSGSLHLELEELIQEGILGLHHACRKYDPERGYKFSTYAFWWIKRYMFRALNSKGRLVKVPLETGEAMFRSDEKRIRLKESLGREPTIKELAEALKISPDQLHYVLTMGTAKPVSLNQKLPESGDDWIDLFAAGSQDEQLADLTQEIEWRLLLNEIPHLPPIEREVICRVYGLMGHQQVPRRELANEMGLSRQGVDYKVQRAVKLLRESLAA
jgi:RNA polymerase sigma factor (sigma-70 family)